MAYKRFTKTVKQSTGRFLAPVALAFLMISSTAMAKLPPTAFKNVTRHFRKGKEAYSPTLGMAALETGLIENIRFFGPFTPGFDTEGQRAYHKDTSTDPLWKIVQILFPSTGGTLTTDSGANTNLGRYVKNPNVIAILLQFTDDVRIGENPKIDTVAESILGVLTLPDKKKSTIKSNLRTQTVKPLLKSIQDSIQEEEKEKSLFPKYTTEQIIEAFFVYKFDKQKDIQTLIEALPETMIDKDVTFSKGEDPLTEKDVMGTIEKTTPYDLDDIFTLGIRDIFYSPTPYHEGVTPLSNGTCKVYNRATNTFDEKKTFADCGEITARHLANLILFNPETRAFDLTTIKAAQEKYKEATPQFKRIQNFIEFYEQQSPGLANAGDIDIRSSWNRVIGDLNEDKTNPVIRYVHDSQYEFETGYFNLLRAFQHIFSLELTPFPKEGEKIEEQKERLKKAFEELFNFLSPSSEIKIDFSKIESETTKQNEPDLFSGISITGQFSKDFSPYSFDIEMKPGHSELTNIKVGKITEDLDSKHPTMVKGHTAEETLYLLSQDFSPSITVPLYKLYNHALADNDSKLDFIETLASQWKVMIGEKGEVSLRDRLSLMLKNVLSFLSWRDVATVENYTELLRDRLSLMLKNVLSSLSWEDNVIVENYTRLLSKLFKNFKENPNEDLQEILFQHTEALYMKETSTVETFEDLLQHFPGLKRLICLDSDKSLSLTFSAENKNLEELYLGGIKITSIIGLERLSALRKLDASNTPGLTSLTFSAENKNLEELYLGGTKITSITGLEHLLALKRLYVSSTDLTSLTFLADNKNLEELYLQRSKITSITGLEHLPALKRLGAKDAQKLTSLTFSAENKNLEELYLGGTKITSITGLEHLLALKRLDVSSTDLTSLTFSAENKNLEELYLGGTKITSITGLEHLLALKRLDASSILSLTSLTFSAENKNLEELNLNYSGVESITGLEHLSALRGLYARGTQKLTSLTFSAENKNLEELNLSYSGVKSITGLEHLLALKRLSVSDTSGLTSLTFSAENKNLEELDLSETNITSITGLSLLPKLKFLDITRCDKLETIKIRKGVTIIGRLSGLKVEEVEDTHVR